MRRRRLVVAFVLGVGAAGNVVPLAPVESQAVGSTSWLSTGLPPAFEGGTASEPAVSADGTTIAFTAIATSQVGRPPSGRSDVFVHDSRRPDGNPVEQISISSDGTAAENGASSQPSVSCDGRFVAFTSEAAFHPDDRDAGARDVYVRDRVTGTTELVSGGVPLDRSGLVVPGAASNPAISGDGRYVAMVATEFQQTRVLPSQVYVYDRVEQTTKLVSRAASGVDAGDGDSFAPALSADGAILAFSSIAALDGSTVPRDPRHTRVFVWRRSDETIRPASVGIDGAPPNGPCGPPAVSQGGRLVAYACLADNLVPGDFNRTGDVFVTDWAARSTTMASVSSASAQGNGNSCASAPLPPSQTSGPPRCEGRVSISGDGRFVAFTSAATNLLDAPRPGGGDIVPAQVPATPGRDTNGAPDVFVRDLDQRRTWRASVRADGGEITDGSSGEPAISYGGRRVAFTSTSRALTDGQCHPERCPANAFFRSDDSSCLACQVSCPPAPTVPRVGVSQSIVPQGRVVTVSGVGFPPSVPVEVTFADRLESVTSDATGSFDAPVVVPHGFPTGEHEVLARSGTRSNQVQLLVVRPTAQPPFPALS